MFRTLRTFFATLIVAFLFSISTSAQNSDNSSNSFLNTGNRSTYFVDEAGLQLAQTVNTLDEFINPDTYQLGPYDAITIQGSGLNEFTYRTIVINAIGDIVVPVAGTISLKNKTLSEAESYLNDYFAKYLKDTEIKLTLDQPRSLNVHIGGNIPNPGRYRVPAGTRYDALIYGFRISSYGSPFFEPVNSQEIQINSTTPSPSGINFDRLSARLEKNNLEFNSLVKDLEKRFDLRLIKVTNNDGSERYIDLKAYFNSGNIDFAPYMQDGDRITMTENSSSRSSISISGAVQSPFTGSYRSDDTLPRLILISGGFTPEADSTHVIRIREDGISIKKESLLINDITEIRPGDQYIIPFDNELKNRGTAELIGLVKNPGIYPIFEGETTIADLLSMSDGLTEKALSNGAYLIRQSDFEDGIPNIQNNNLSALTKSSDQFIEGFDYLELEETLSPNRMPLDLNSQLAMSTKVFDGDRIIIPEDQNIISVIGQVNNPGFFDYDSTLSAQEYISKANGKTIAADINRVFVIKAGSHSWFKPVDTTIESGDIIFVDRIPFEDVSTGRNYSLQLQQLKNTRTQLWIAGIGTFVSIVTAYAAITR